MDLRQLDALLAVAEHGTFSAAAQALHTVQSNVSTHVARLEDELGTVLVDRSTRTLTPEGEVVVARARVVRQELEAIGPDLAGIRREVAGNVVLGIIGSAAGWLAHRLARATLDTHPGITLSIIEASTAQLRPRLARHELDAAVVNLPVEDRDVTAEKLFSEDVVVATLPDHPLAALSAVTPHDLAAHGLLLPARGTTFRTELDADLNRMGIMLKGQIEVDGVRVLTEMAAQGLGPALVPASAAQAGEPVRILPVEGIPSRTVGLARPRTLGVSAATRAVLDLLRDLVATEGAAQHGIHPVT